MPTIARLNVQRLTEKFSSDESRVITRPFIPGDAGRIERIINRVCDLTEEDVHTHLDEVYRNFSERHRDLRDSFRRRFNAVVKHVPDPDALSEERRMLIGAYFTMEYSIESAALFNPSMVPMPPDMQNDPDRLRFIMSLRATGEGHVSSIVFRTGYLDSDAHIHFEPASKFASRMKVVQDRSYEKKLFFLKLIEMGAYSDTARVILDELKDDFSFNDLSRTIDEIRHRKNRPHPFSETAENMLWLARSNYHLQLPEGTDPSEVVIFPTSENESKGIEDVRLTLFTDDDGTTHYYGTYTAYNGYRILPQILETKDFTDISIHTLNGRYVQNKGMALFPRKINGQYHMASRLDGENMFIMKSDNIFFWNECERFVTPKFHWEFVQLGNCGAPIETDDGWLLLTHGVSTASARCCWTKKTPRKSSATLPSPCSCPTRTNATATCPTWSIPAAAWCMRAS